ncbi:MAG: membrane integrity-associated transporter subunit PqiC [Syntrophaceae bacterium]|nr:membrane integrity-associated transporter subunit PqiC [Syntrophaceae bacterium]
MRQLLTHVKCHKKIISLCFMVIALSLVIGCAGSGKPKDEVENYLLNYAVPSWDKADKFDVSLKFNRFSIAAAYNSANMMFRNDLYSIDSFNYSRWAVNPADMVADSLLRDMRESGLFRAVFSRYETDEGIFLIFGGIEEFYLFADKSNKTAVISIVISLQDTREKETAKKLIFQKKYFRKEPLHDSSPRGYCQAASQAMRVISQQITDDVYAAIKTTSPSAVDHP